MTSDQIRLQIELEGKFYNHWPYAQICINDHVLFDAQVQELVYHDFFVDVKEKNQLKIIHYGKRFGDDGVYDCSSDQTGDCVLQIKDIKFETVSIFPELMSKLFFETCWTPAQLKDLSPKFLEDYAQVSCHAGVMNFNSIFKLDFEIPVLNWLTLAKYKIPAKNTAYFSSYDLRWHYEEDLKLLEEIKALVKL